jgi:AraC-like DNA-binding protein
VPHLCVEFARSTGTTLHRTLIRLRLRAALERLQDPRCDLSALAHEVGFSSHSHFTAVFRRTFGHPPGQEREALKKAASGK